VADAVVLLSGGLDSATALAVARDRGFDCLALSFEYGQRHDAELTAARRVAERGGAREHRLLRVDPGVLTGSALTDETLAVPEGGPGPGIPVTYVPARNTVFLAHALAVAEIVGAADLFLGVNVVDYSGYPDCRPEFVAAFERLANLGTRAGVEGAGIAVHAPLIGMDKADIIRLGTKLGVDYSVTVSCYQPDTEGWACGLCDACHFRARGFRDAGVRDPTPYQR